MSKNPPHGRAGGHRERAGRQRRGPFVPALDRPDGAAQYAGLMEAKRRRQRALRIALGLASSSLVAAALLGTDIARGSELGIAALAGAGVLAVFALFYSNKFLSRDAYYSVSGSTDDEGEHRCLKCGHRGIHRSTVYKTETTEAHCSKCRFPLWRE